MVKAKGETISSSELQGRYGCTLRTIQAKQRKLGFPMGSIFSKEYEFSWPAVVAWEKVHMPHLHAVPAAPPADDDDEWNAMKNGEPPEEGATPKKKKKTARKK